MSSITLNVNIDVMYVVCNSVDLLFMMMNCKCIEVNELSQ